MKVIIKALNETEYKPRKKWWGFVRNGLRYLCRYNHIMCIFEGKKLVYKFYETKTDKVGVEFAIKHINNDKVF